MALSDKKLGGCSRSSSRFLFLTAGQIGEEIIRYKGDLPSQDAARKKVGKKLRKKEEGLIWQRRKKLKIKT